MAYEPINWKDFPNEETPLSSFNLNHMDTQIKRNADDIEEHTGDIELISKDVQELNKNIVTTDKATINDSASIDGAEGNIEAITFYGNTEKVGNELITPQGKVESLGSNNLVKEIFKYSLNNETGQIGQVSSNHFSTSYVSVEPNTEYTFSTNIALSSSAKANYVFQYDVNKNYLGSSKRTTQNPATNEWTFTTDADARYIRFSRYDTNGLTIEDSSWVQIEKGSNVTPYEPYKGSTINASEIAPNKPLYGIGDIKNTLEVFADGSGVYTQRIGSVDLGTRTYVYDSNNEYYQTQISGKAVGETNLLTSRYTVARNTGVLQDYQICGRYNNAYIYIKDSSVADANALKTSLNGVELIYELSTPIITPLTSKEVAEFLSLKTFNNGTITADALTDIVYYKNNGNGQTISNLGARVNANTNDIADTKSMISDEWLSTKTYAQGEYCIYDNKLWKSKVGNNLGNIPTEGSYWTTSSVGAELTSLVKKRSIKITTDTNGAVVSPISTDNIILSIVPHYNLVYATPYFRTAGLYGFFVASSSDNSRLKNTVVDIDIYYI